MEITCLEGDNETDGDVPPGFTSLMSVKFSRVHNNRCGALDVESCKRSTLTQKPWVNKQSVNDSLEEASISGLDVSENCVLPKKILRKGVLRGCIDCANCQKVNARWCPGNGCRPILDEAPVFYPNEQEFEDTLKYIATIRPIAEKYGICRIVPPSSWKPPCLLKEKDYWEDHKFPTVVQSIDKLQNPCNIRQVAKHSRSPNWKTQHQVKLEDQPDNGFFLKNGQFECKSPYEMVTFESGPDFTLQAFEDYADYFKEQYFLTEGETFHDKLDDMQRVHEPSVESVEGEYWRIVQKPTESIEVLDGAEIETKAFGSGFPKASSEGYDSENKYVKSGWNLNNSARLPGSVLSFESANTSGISVPWLYVGMCFSSFCWHVEDHHLYSLNYMHLGAPKVWYGVPGRAVLKLEGALKKYLPALFEERHDLLHKLVTQLSPDILKFEGVPVFRCVQHSGEFVVTFPKAYHSGFNCGFNCAEAVNIAPIDWLPYGQNFIELYCKQRHKRSIFHDKLLLEAANEAIRTQWGITFERKLHLSSLPWADAYGHDKILTKAFKSRLELERLKRDFFCFSNSRRMDADFDSKTERECCFCHSDLHLSAVSCSCSPEKFACLCHVKEICSCDLNLKIFLFRYNISELNLLFDALDGKLSAVYKWGVSQLGLSLSSFVKNVKSHNHNLASFSSSEGKSKERPGPSLCPNTSKKQKRETEIQKGETNVQSSMSARPLNEDGFIDERLKVTEACSSSSSKSLSCAGSHHFGQDAFDVRLEMNTTLTADANPATCFTHTEKVSVGSGNMEQPCEDGNRTSIQCGPNPNQNDCDIEVLEYGVICPGNLWSNHHTIFPKGYKSRVRYFSILDPSQMCYYVSHILDGGTFGPLFLVQPEHASSEVFIHTSAIKCWNMVRECVNREITRQHSFGNFNVPKMQSPNSVDGLEMFGFSSQKILQAIEKMDENHLCSEYWKARSQTSIAKLQASVMEVHGFHDNSHSGSADI